MLSISILNGSQSIACRQSAHFSRGISFRFDKPIKNWQIQGWERFQYSAFAFYSVPGDPMICFLTKDLMMSSTASSHARQKKIKLLTVSSLERAIAMIQESRPHLLIVDLQTPGLNVELLGEEIQGLADAVCPLTIAYAQHVNVELLEQAKTARFDQVLTRGQFNSRIAEIVADV